MTETADRPTDATDVRAERATCLIAGGGPAGMVLGLLLARGGVQVTVLEKHADFLRDFRGDTVHASTIRLLDQLGLGEAFRALPQSRLGNFRLPDRHGRSIVLGDFSTLRPPYDHVAMVPQWDLLTLLVEAAEREPTFTLRMSTEVTDLVRDAGGRVVGVRVHDRGRDAAGARGVILADLVVACDGRSSVLRERAGLVPRRFDVSFDTWWFRLPRTAEEQQQVGSLEPRFAPGEAMLSFTRPTYYQVAYFAPKGDDARLRAEGVEAFRARVARLRPDLADRVGAIGSVDDLHHLDVKVDRLRRWARPGLLCLGDAAHAMSPIGGVGINLAVQDAVAAATLLRGPLLRGDVTLDELDRVRRRRRLPTVVIQRMQLALDRTVFGPTLNGRTSPAIRLAPWVVRHLPFLRLIGPRMIAFGPRPEQAPDFARRPPVPVG
ncbi:2-polyprenyl-6-methoxyphenol hydroxylase-like FAD-dependent oxidoreductase [Friedmanniella endophytica]|uniref:2-polyprenyl-6-methoxyphenol hydroxylase-like FAD-dependent oxidoreductase n=1 Tax=Microlunatus kandeliicorticis TaxID=1759536 RepID=A0A7W3IQ53_9ACTN|nr:FAD-dependent oxidoreductase [Microlunatus kandeliicorticis]MBA8793164.1 2-polyprenyl-6-methoxyphenol hydroxylase-like FAD-dependent oxidoreductase [Microlunatus kandeliicorticis]